MWHARRVTFRTAFAALLAAAIGLGSAGAAEAQLWKPKKKTTVTAPAKKKTRSAPRKKRPVRKAPVVTATPDADEDTVASRSDRDRDRSDRDIDYDDRPRISVVDGDRD